MLLVRQFCEFVVTIEYGLPGRVTHAENQGILFEV